MGNTAQHGKDGKEVAVLLFGSQVASLSKQSLDDISNTLLDGLSRKWILHTLVELPIYWDALAKAIPKITDTIGNRGVQLLADLESWLRQGGNGDNAALKQDLPSVVLSPLVVLTQLVQYRRYLEANRGTGSTTDLHADLVAQGKTSTLGFCMGMVSAFAVASASNYEELDKYGSVAVRLAMVGGALIDAQDKWNEELGLGPSESFVTAWRNTKQRDDLHRIVDGLFPEAYVSVLYDEARETVTTSQRAAPRLLRQLHKAGITTAEVGFHGEIHSPKPEARAITDSVIAFCNDVPGLQFPDAARLVLPSYTNAGDGTPITPGAGSMHEIAVRAVFTEQCRWYSAFSGVKTSRLDDNEDLVVAFGPDQCAPPTMVNRLGRRIVHFSDLKIPHDRAQPSVETEKRQQAPPESKENPDYNKFALADKDAIAVVGMSIKVAGADDLDEFSQMLRTGESQHQLIPPERMNWDSLFRDDDKVPQGPWYANLMRDIDAFDHKFFKRSPRESATMDPQQRLLLQAAYQAVEQSGYFTESARSSRQDEKERAHAGVFIGVPAVDYDQNISSHNPNAFTATGNLMAFLPGKVAHHFGWTGPAMVLDTACSASAVAIHTACRSLLAGDCNSALAGGCALFLNSLWFHNLAAASFLSPTGQCKPFDEKADGFCRAESVSVVFLKRMSDAVADGSPILGCIPSTLVYQNQNSTALFVPNSPSLSELFRDVVKNAHMTPSDISLLEAHGTGTPVGDPAEYESIREVMGGTGVRSTPLPIGSLKGHIGHTEGVSGVNSLIKVLLMMRENYIPPQASFDKINPAFHASPADMLEVVTALRPWSDSNDRKIALINNYGAGGSNSALVAMESPYTNSGVASAPIRNIDGQQPRFPFAISGIDSRSIKAYADKLVSLIKSGNGCLEDVQLELADLSFGVNRLFNPTLPQRLVFSCRTMAELEDKLSSVASPKSSPELSIEPVKTERPVILCFGGQVSRFVGLDRKLYDSVSILRQHLDECDAVMQSESLGLGSIYPEIFSREPFEDTVRLQTMLFAMQYASAMSWMDCGLSGKIAAVVGHSFGELTALCISGVLSLQDAILLVARRSQLVRDAWGPDKGAMMAVEADEALVQELLTLANSHGTSNGPANIACYNGPRSFTLAGPIEAIDAVAETIAKNSKFSTVKSKKLNVTNAFHSSLVDPLLERLEQVGKDLKFHDPKIPLERATETKFVGPLTANFVPDHMRKPVFFNHAIQRLAKEHPSAIFLEAGSNSTITIMASRALMGQAAPGSSNHFQTVNITNDQGLDGLTDATVSLQKQGIYVSFWPHHAQQTNEYASLILPPYQFEKNRHWLEQKVPSEVVAKEAARLVESQGLTMKRGGHDGQDADEKHLGLWTFVGYLDDEKDKKSKKKSKKHTPSHPRFRINTGSDKYMELISGHVIAETAPICPGTLQVDMAIESLFSLHPEWKADGLVPMVQDLTNHSPLCVDPSRMAWIDFQPLDEDQMQWEWNLSSGSRSGSGDAQTTLHARSRIHVRSPTDPAYVAEFARFERLVSYVQCAAVLAAAGRDGDGVDADALSGRNVYRTFKEYVDYSEIYRGVRTVVGRGDESAGRVNRRHTGDSWLDVLLDDSFSQVSGIWVNCMTDGPAGDMYIANGCETSMRSPRGIIHSNGTQDMWHVYSRNARQSDSGYVSDLFVFDAASGKLAEVMLGIQYSRVSKVSMSRMLTKLTKDKSVLKNTNTVTVTSDPAIAAVVAPTRQDVRESSSNLKPKKQKKPAKKTKATSGRPDITEEVKQVVSTVAGMEAGDVTLDTELSDIGIDSLMAMELSREIDVVFKCTLGQAELLQATNLRQLVVLISSVLFGANGDAVIVEESSVEEDSNDSSSDDWSKDDNLATPPSHLDTSTATPYGEKSAPSSVTGDLELSGTDILECFGAVKMNTDKKICEFQLDITDRVIVGATNRLCVALIVEAFDKLGYPLSAATAGDTIERVPYLPEYERLMDWIYGFLESEARLVDKDPVSGKLTRTAFAVPLKSSETIKKELLEAYPDWDVATKLIYHAGKPFADILSGKTDGIQVLFGTAEGTELQAALYRDHPFNIMLSGQMRDLISRIVERVQASGGESGPLKILEMGAGTGGTTHALVPFLASLDIPVEYTFTDLSSSLVAVARRTFGKQYPFMKFAVHDIEKPPAEELRGQHIIIASNAVHATHSLVESGTNIHKALRDDGFLMLLEQIECMPFSNLIFGLFEGWWLFDDGRTHACVSTDRWERDLHTAGFGHVDWTDGQLLDNKIQKVIVALASGPIRERLPIPASPPVKEETTKQSPRDIATREAEAEKYVAKYTAGWAEALKGETGQRKPATPNSNGNVVVVTGATGSLGSHLVASFAENASVKTVVCINRRSGTSVETRQAEAFTNRGITLSPEARSKLRILETDTSRPQLGLAASDYEWLAQNGTHIVHNAWPMSGTRPVPAFEPQFQVMRNLLDLAREMACRTSTEAGHPIGFQLVTSIGVVGHAGKARVFEERVPIASTLPTGYCQGKWICERMLDETLHKYKSLFRPMVIRPGQIAGSTTSGFWNPVEHFAFLIKSAQSLGAFPDFDGIMQWIPVDAAANIMADLLYIGDEANAPEASPVYHIDNPVGQPWKEMSPVLAGALGIPSDRIVPFHDWLRRVCHSPLEETENPASRPELFDFLDGNYERMSCGGLILDTSKAKAHSKTMAAQGAVSPEIARSYYVETTDPSKRRGVADETLVANLSMACQGMASWSQYSDVSLRELITTDARILKQGKWLDTVIRSYLPRDWIREALRKDRRIGTDQNETDQNSNPSTIPKELPDEQLDLTGQADAQNPNTQKLQVSLPHRPASAAAEVIGQASQPQPVDFRKQPGKHYRYTALGKEEIRLLAIQPGLESSPITITISHASLRRPPKYRALSNGKFLIIICGPKLLRWRSFDNFTRYGFPGTLGLVPPPLEIRTATKLQKIFSAEALFRKLAKTRPCRATDPRDKIFALLPLFSRPSGGGTTGFSPNYSRSTRDTFVNLAKYLLKTTEVGFNLLYAIEPGSILSGLPSWVPDWSVVPKTQYMYDPQHLTAVTKTLKTDDFMIEFLDGGVLSLLGTYRGKVNHVGGKCDTEDPQWP
ncbi:Fc.00g046460.m01.CDS01 [Cosmosporella sp. VM-42]